MSALIPHFVLRHPGKDFTVTDPTIPENSVCVWVESHPKIPKRADAIIVKYHLYLIDFRCGKTLLFAKMTRRATKE